MRPQLRSLAMLAITIAACRSDSLPFTPRSAAEGVSGSGAVADLRARRDAWLATGPRRYAVIEQLSCMCPDSPEFRPAVVEVRNRVVSRVWSLETSRAFVPREGTLLSVERLFDLAIETAERGERVIVRYDASLGYPVYLSLGEPERDAGVIYVLAGLRPL